MRVSELVLVLYPFSRGLAFALFEGPLSPVDWGLKDVRGNQKNALMLQASKDLIDRYQPEVVILQEHTEAIRSRGPRLQRIERMIATYAAGQSIECRRYTRADIRHSFQASGAVTRYEIAQVISGHLPAFSYRLPRMKKLWQTEDRRMALFDAVSLAVAHFCAGVSAIGKEGL